MLEVFLIVYDLRLHNHLDHLAIDIGLLRNCLVSLRLMAWPLVLTTWRGSFGTMLQASLKTEKEKKKEMYFPLRKYAIKV